MLNVVKLVDQGIRFCSFHLLNQAAFSLVFNYFDQTNRVLLVLIEADFFRVLIPLIQLFTRPVTPPLLSENSTAGLVFWPKKHILQHKSRT